MVWISSVVSVAVVAVLMGLPPTFVGSRTVRFPVAFESFSTAAGFPETCPRPRCHSQNVRSCGQSFLLFGQTVGLFSFFHEYTARSKTTTRGGLGLWCSSSVHTRKQSLSIVLCVCVRTDLASSALLLTPVNPASCLPFFLLLLPVLGIRHVQNDGTTPKVIRGLATGRFTADVPCALRVVGEQAVVGLLLGTALAAGGFVRVCVTEGTTLR